MSKVVITVAAGSWTPELKDNLKMILATHPGPDEVRIHLRDDIWSSVIQTDPRFRVAFTPALRGEVASLLGANAMRRA